MVSAPIVKKRRGLRGQCTYCEKKVRTPLLCIAEPLTQSEVEIFEFLKPIWEGKAIPKRYPKVINSKLATPKTKRKYRMTNFQLDAKHALGNLLGVVNLWLNE